MSSPILEKANQLFEKLQTNPEADSSTLCEQMIELFPVLSKEDQKNFSFNFYHWAEKHKIKYPLIFCYAGLLELADNFFSEQLESVLAEGPALQKAFLKNNEPSAAASIEAFIGSVHRTLGNIDLSLKSLWDAYGQLNELNRFPHFKMASSFHIGSIYMDVHNYDEALSILKSTLSLAEKLQDSFWIVYTSHGLGKLFLKQRNYENAHLMFEKAIWAADKAGLPSLLSSAETEMGNYYFETGNYDESEILHTKAVNNRLANNFVSGAITNLIRLGEINMKQSQPDDAIAMLNKGLAFAEQAKLKPKMYQIHLLLSEAYHRKNDLVRSIFHYKQYHYLWEQVALEDNGKKIKNVKLVFEAEQTKKENSIIKMQKAEIQKKNIALQTTIDELTITKAGKKAKAFTLLIAMLFFILEDSVLHFIFHLVPANNFWLSLGIKMAFIFSLKPINGAIEHYLVKKIIRKKSQAGQSEEPAGSEIPAGLNFAA